MRTSLALLLAVPALLVPSLAEAGPFSKKEVPAVAVWDLQTTDVHANAGAGWYAEIAESIARVPDVVVDEGRDFLPTVRPSEGIRISIDIAQRRMEAAWTALRGREYALASDLIAEALELVGEYPAERLPEGLMRDLKVLQARVQLAAGERGAASMTLQAALALDPGWEPRRDIEHPDFTSLYDEVDARRSQAPTGVVTIRATVPNVRVLVHGTEQGRVHDGTLTLELPPGVYRIVGRKAGHADDAHEVRVRPKDDKQIELALSVQNSVQFQESVQGALEAPRRQRATGVWDGLAMAAEHVDARAVLVGRYVADGETDGRLHVGLYLPGRGGWGFHRVIDVSSDRDAVSSAVDDAVYDLTSSLEAELDPVFLALGE